MRLVSDPLISQSAADARYKTLEAVIAPTLLNGWVNYGGALPPAGYRKTPQGMVIVRGTLKNGTVGLPAFTLPVGYRAPHDLHYPAVSNDAFGVVLILPAGIVQLNSGSNIYFAMNHVLFATD